MKLPCHYFFCYWSAPGPVLLWRVQQKVNGLIQYENNSELCWCRSSLLKTCSLMKHKVPVPPFSKPSCRYVQICSVFHRGILHLFLYNQQQVQKWFCWRDYFGYSVLFCHSIAFASPWFGAASSGSSVPRDEQHFVPVEQLSPRKHSPLRKLWPVTKLAI